ncbi:hypothetical protein [Sphingomonas sp. Leaf339]|uniref:hypothetical protein n=1 Tax=Sphingomonas sp. Leaf339 TaxID=1736343 RepID=UPI0009E6E0B2|nr:hypothetical protein [Sphingomonas sp. Leaf339]
MSNGWDKAQVRPLLPIDDASADRARLRAEERAGERERRAHERLDATQDRSDRRASEREQAARDREQAREQRRLEEAGRIEARSTDRTEQAAAQEERPKRRRSGALARTGEVQRERDTRHYQTVVDTGRVRELARRGASISGLAGAFGISTDEVAAILADDGADGEPA